MSTIVACPECQRKLKVAPASIGRSVKCTCGHVFKARPSDVASTAAPAADIMVVSCDGCQTKLKVPIEARGRKMKCSRCATIFVVADDEAASAPPARKRHTPPPFGEESAEEESALPRRRSRTAAGVRPPFPDEDETEVVEEKPRSRRKTKPFAVAGAADEDTPSRTPAVPAARGGGWLLNLFVLLIVLTYIAAFVPVYLGFVPLPFEKPPPQHGPIPNRVIPPEVK